VIESIIVIIVKDNIPTKHADQLIQFQPEEDFPSHEHFLYTQQPTQGQPLNSQGKLSAGSQDKMKAAIR
jgi:hypothetical protein